jgi:hypothetical protein
MSTANLNVWITKVSDPCHIDDTTPYFVHVLDCSGNVVEWCGKRYTFLPAKCGHLALEVPPGCYVVVAGISQSAGGEPPFGNALTHVQVVRINCGDHACVTLFAPTLHFCGTWFGQATVLATGGGKINVGLANAAVKAIRALLDTVPVDPFTQNTLALLEEPKKR